VLPAEDAAHFATPDQKRFIRQTILAAVACPRAHFMAQLLPDDIGHGSPPKPGRSQIGSLELASASADFCRSSLVVEGVSNPYA
jgi:hypothetical protein